MSKQSGKKKISGNAVTLMSADIISPQNNQDRAEKGRQLVRKTVCFDGPIPPPDILAGYESISKGLAKEIIDMAKDEANHRRECEKKALQADIDIQHKSFSEARVGQFCALSIGITAIVAGVVAAVMGAQWPGGLIGSSGVYGLVYVFIKGRQPAQSPEKQSNEENLPDKKS